MLRVFASSRERLRVNTGITRSREEREEEIARRIGYSTHHMKDDTLSKISDLKDRLQSVRSYL